MAPSSNECYVANVDGDVVRTRSVARVVEASRWDLKAVEKIRGLPGHTVVIGQAHAGAEPIEESLEPHVDADHEDRFAQDVEDDRKKRNAEDVRITMRDLRLYGFHPGICLRCDDCRRGNPGSWHRHSDECRWRIYKAYRDAGDKKFQNVKHLFEDDKVPDVGQADIDLNASAAAAAVPTPIAAAAPGTPREQIPLRRSSDDDDDEPEQRGQWEPAAYQPGDFAAMDTKYPTVDHFLPDDEDDNPMDADVSENQMMDALLAAGVEDEVAANFMRAIMRQSTRPRGTKSDRAGDRHIERSERNSRTADPKAAPVAKSGEGK